MARGRGGTGGRLTPSACVPARPTDAYLMARHSRVNSSVAFGVMPQAGKPAAPGAEGWRHNRSSQPDARAAALLPHLTGRCCGRREIAHRSPLRPGWSGCAPRPPSSRGSPARAQNRGPSEESSAQREADVAHTWSQPVITCPTPYLHEKVSCPGSLVDLRRRRAGE